MGSDKSAPDIIVAGNSSIRQIDDAVPSHVRTHKYGGISVESHLSLGVEPTLGLKWTVTPRHWRQGFTLMVFRNSTGFCPEKYPDDLNRHGELIVETTSNGSHLERLAEGTYYYTFLVHKRYFFDLREKIRLLRFSECIPSAKIGIGRIKDQIELRDMRKREELGVLEHETQLNEAELRLIESGRRLEESTHPPALKKKRVSDPVLSKEIADVDALIETCLARRSLIDRLKSSKRFSRLTPDEQNDVMDMIRQRLDAGEISARREMRG